MSWPLCVAILGAVLSLAAAATLAYYWLPREAGPWQGLFDRALMTPDEALVARAHEQLWAGRLEGPGGALEAFAAALRRDPASPYRWCELGDAFLEAGRIDQARRCFQRGVELGPGTPSILMRAANLHFRLGEPRQALPYTRRVLEMTSEFDQVIFSSWGRLGATVEEVLAQALPPDRRAGQAFLRYLIDEGAVASAEPVWRWVRARSFADDSLADGYAGFLAAQRQYARALEAWAEHFGPRSPGFPRASRVFNGGFETELAGRTFDWRIESLEGVEIERDNATSAAGHWALRVRFLGQENLEFRHLSQRAVVHPGPWRFQAALRAADLTTDQGVAFEVLDAEAPGRLSVKTAPLLGTRDWHRIEMGLMVPPETRVVEVRLVRAPSLKFDNKIRGTVWIDEVRLVPVR